MSTHAAIFFLLLSYLRMHLQDPRLEVLPCMHSGTYADDCICERIRQHKCYIVATCDRDLRRRIRKVLLPLCHCHVCDFCCSNVGMRLPSIAEHTCHP